MPQKKFVATEILLFDFELFIGVLFCDTREKGPTVSQATSPLGKRDSVWIT
jgi:hypothetical protein